MIDLGGKTILVTGASRGIGAATARVLGLAGAEVVLHYASAREAAQEIALDLGPDKARLVQADLAEPGAGDKLWRDALEWRGKIDVLVNNAGVYLAAGVDDGIEAWSETWARTLQINLVALADLCRAAILQFRTDGGGIVINIASRAAFRGDHPDYLHYAASKGGVVALTRSIARGFAKDGVLAYAVAPGFVATDMARDFVEVHGDEQILRGIPLGELAPPEEVANIVAFLASGLARHATGTTIDINGASYVR